MLMLSFALGHNWIDFLGDVDFCGPPLSANVPRRGNKQKYAPLLELKLWLGTFSLEAVL